MANCNQIGTNAPFRGGGHNAKGCTPDTTLQTIYTTEMQTEILFPVGIIQDDLGEVNLMMEG